MIWVDYAIIAIVVGSAAISLLRGFVKDAISLLGWVLAFWLALKFADDVSALLETFIFQPSMRHGVAFTVVVIATLMITAVVMYLVGLVVDKSKLTATDRVLGMVFGIARGIVIVAMLVMFAGLTSLPNEPWWSDSTLLPYFQALATEIHAILPPEVADLFHY